MDAGGLVVVERGCTTLIDARGWGARLGGHFCVYFESIFLSRYLALTPPPTPPPGWWIIQTTPFPPRSWDKGRKKT